MCGLLPPLLWHWQGGKREEGATGKKLPKEESRLPCVLHTCGVCLPLPESTRMITRVGWRERGKVERREHTFRSKEKRGRGKESKESRWETSSEFYTYSTTTPGIVSLKVILGGLVSRENTLLFSSLCLHSFSTRDPHPPHVPLRIQYLFPFQVHKIMISLSLHIERRAVYKVSGGRRGFEQDMLIRCSLPSKRIFFL